MASAYNTICTAHHDTINTSFLKWLKNACNTSMIEISKCTSPGCFIGDAFQPGSRKIAKQDLSTMRWATADLLWKVAYGKVDGVCRLVSEKGELCLVR